MPGTEAPKGKRPQSGNRGGRPNNKDGQAPPKSAPAKQQQAPKPAKVETEEQKAARLEKEAAAKKKREEEAAAARAEEQAREEKRKAIEAAKAAEAEAKVAAEKAAADRLDAFVNIDAAKVVESFVKAPFSVESLAYLSDVKEYIVHAKKPEARLAALNIIKALATCEKKACFQPTVLNLLVAVLDRCDDRDAKVRTLAEETGLAIAGLVDVYSMSSSVPVIFEAMDNSKKWRGKKTACELLAIMADRAPKQVLALLPDIIPVLVAAVWDTKPEVKKAAHDTLESIVGVVENKDVEPILDTLLTALITPEEVLECVHTLAGVTFIHTVDAPVLALISPILERGFDAKKTAVKRQCCVIIGNMVKLVLHPAEALPFIETHLPLVTKAADEIADPEAREVAERVQHQLQRIVEGAGAAPHVPLATVLKEVHEVAHLKTNNDCPNQENYVQYTAHIAQLLTNQNVIDLEMWNISVKPLLIYLSGDATKSTSDLQASLAKHMNAKDEDEVEDDAEVLCDCNFTLAYGNKVLLHNAHLKLKRGYRYGLLGGNDSGKTTLMRNIAAGQLEGFPPPTELRTVFVEADIQGELSHLACVDYVFEDERIKACGASREQVTDVLKSVGFSEKMCGDAVSTLSGGWRMKLALARAMIQKADILLLDEPTNHLDVTNVAWVEHYLNSLTNVTSIIVSHDRGVLDNCCTHILQIEDLKMHMHTGNLSDYVAFKPSAMSFFSMKETKLKFKLPPPAFLDGVKSKGKVLLKMNDITFTYPGNDKPTVMDLTVQVSMSSRVGCIGPNGAGKSTLIKLLTGELVPQQGVQWRHKEVRVAYVAQHAFHHIEKHMNKTANEYIRWRYEFGEDKEGLDKESMTVTEEEAAALRVPVMIDAEDKNGNKIKVKRTPDSLTGNRRGDNNNYQYEMKWQGMGVEDNSFLTTKKLLEMGFEKQMRLVDVRCRMKEGMYFRSLTQANVEGHLADLGLEAEYATHNRIGALSAGQKVKVVLAAATWNQPHIIVLDEPTNYLSTDALGALAGAIEEFEGGIVIISHNDEFVKTLCPETWVVEAGRVNVKGDADWMKNALAAQTNFTVIEEMTDALGNVTKVKESKKNMSRKEKKARERARKIRRAAGEVVSDSEDDE